MACTSRSAVDFIGKARSLLVQHLKNQTLIAEKLKDLEVFNSDNVAEVTCEKNPLEQTRKILEFVTKKGEEASYQFLRILDSERNRTLPKNVKPDLHQWISCFSFRPEPDMEPTGSRLCQLYQNKLKTKAQAILKSHSKQMKSLLEYGDVDSFFYTPLVLDTDEQRCSVSKIKLKSKKYKKCRTKKLVTYIPKNTSLVSPEDLLKCNGKDILLIGKPGIGKTAVTLEMINLWTSMENKRLNYFFYFNETTLPDMSKPIGLESLLFDAYVEPSSNREEVLQDIKENSEHVIIIIDGIKDVPLNCVLHRIMEKDILPEAKIVLTCRPEYEEVLLQWEAYRVSVQGFSEESLQAYLSHVLKTKPDAVKLIMGNLELRSLCHVPSHAFMTAVCMLFCSAEAPNLCTATEIYLNIFRHVMNKCEQGLRLSQLDNFIQSKKEKILHLCKLGFNAIKQRSIVLQDCEDNNIVHHFLNQFTIRGGPTLAKTYGAFLHNTMQEFFAALWLLANPDDIDGVLLDCKNEEGRHMRHVIPFLSGLLSQKNVSLVKCLFPEEHIELISGGFHEKLIRAFLQTQADHGDEDEIIPDDNDEDFVFLCQCLFELQSPQLCSVFLSKMKYCLKLMDGCLDPYQCCAMSHVIKMSKDKKVALDLKNCDVSEQVLKLIIDCCQHFRVDPCSLQTIWTAALSFGNPRLFSDLLNLFGPDLHLPVWKPSVFKRAAEVIRQNPKKIGLILHWDPAQSLSEAVYKLVLGLLPYINSVRLTPSHPESVSPEEWKQREKSFHLDLCLQAALSERESVLTTVRTLLTLSSVYSESDFLLDLYSRARDYESQTGRRLIEALQSVYQSAPAVWSIDLSKRKASLLLQVLKLQTQKKPLELMGWSDEESELRVFLQCLPYISELKCVRLTPSHPESVSPEEWKQREKSFHLDLCLQAALSERESILTTVRTLLTLSSVYSESDFLLDLYSRARDYESQTGRSLIVALQSVYQSAPAVWSIDLSERRATIFLEVLKLQTQKKPLELMGWSDEEGEMRDFLQCLPYISELKCVRLTPSHPESVSPEEWKQREKSFHLDLCLQAALSERESVLTTVRTLLTLSSVYSESDFLLDLYSRARDYESQTGRSLIDALQSVYQSAPVVWFVDLSGRRATIFLEVLKLQTQRKPVQLVELTGCPDDWNEVRAFLLCLPFILQLRFTPAHNQRQTYREWTQKVRTFQLNLCLQAALAGGQTISAVHVILKLFNGSDEKSDFLLDLYSHMKNFGIQSGIDLLSAFQIICQSAHDIWSVDLSERKASLFLEVLKLQTQKRPVELRGWSNDESELRVFLQCLPYIPQLRLTPSHPESVSPEEWKQREKSFHLDLCLQAALSEREFVLTTVRTLLTLSSVYRESDFLLDLYSHARDYESQTGRSLIDVLQSVYQSAPAVWSIDLSKRKASLLLEVLKLQTQKRPVELRGWSDEESELRSFLQCLPYISQLSFHGILQWEKMSQFLLNVCVAAAEHSSATGENLSGILSPVCTFLYENMEYGDWHWHTDFLLDLCSRVNDFEVKTGRTLHPALKIVYQSTPAVWSVDLSKRKASLLLEVLKLQTQKEPLELTGLSDDESELRVFLQCLPYISQLRFHYILQRKKVLQFLLNICVTAAEHSSATGENLSENLSPVCTFLSEERSEYDDCHWHTDLLLDLCCRVVDPEVKTGSTLHPALHIVYPSVPAVWSIDLSERKASLLLEVLKLQTQKRPVELRGWSDEESELRSFLQCLPYISQLSFHYFHGNKQFLLNVCVTAAEHSSATGENLSVILSPVCTFLSEYMKYGYWRWHTDFLLDLRSCVSDLEVKTGRTLHPALQSVYQSAPAVWHIDLSKRKASLLLEVLKLQTQKTPVLLSGWSDEESEVRSFLQCLPYISQLSFHGILQWETMLQFLLNVCVAAAEHSSATGDNLSGILSPVCTFLSEHMKYGYWRWHTDFLLDLCSRVNDLEVKTGRTLHPALQSVYQSVPAVWSIDLSERKASLLLEVLELQTQKRPVELRGCSDEESEVRSFLQCLPYISQLSFHPICEKKQFLLNVCVAAAEHSSATGDNLSGILSPVCTFLSEYMEYGDCRWHTDFLLDLRSCVSDLEVKTGRTLHPALQSVYQSAPKEWSIDLSERKASLLLEVLKLQTQKRQVQLRGWSDEESDVRSFLQCLPYISQLRFGWHVVHKESSKIFHFLVNLSVAAAEHDSNSGEGFSELLSTACSYSTFPLEEGDDDIQCDFLLDLYLHLETCGAETAKTLPPVFQQIYQSAPDVWFIDLSKRKASLLEVLKLQTQKRPVELTGWADEESEVRSFLLCLPYISQLRFTSNLSRSVKFLVHLSVAAAEHDSATGESFSELLSSVCSYRTFPFCWEINSEQSDLLLELYSCVKHHETETGRSLLPVFHPVYQSAPAVWSIDLSERKASLLLEVLKLQTQKRPVELRGWSDEESEVRSFLQCLPYISQLRFTSNSSRAVKFLVHLSVAAAEHDSATGESFSELLSSVCSYSTFPFGWERNSEQNDLLLELYSCVKHHETETGRSLLPVFHPVYQSAPAVWSIDLSERKASLLLEVLKLQTQKRPVELRGWSDEEREVRSFLQCLPYISQLRFMSNSSRAVKFLVHLSVAAAEHDSATGESFSELLSSVCSYSTFPFGQERNSVQSDLLLELYSCVKHHETETGRSLLPVFHPVYQSAPAVWSIDLSERKASLLLEVLKLQTQKRPVELRGWSDEESEVRSFLQCLPYISQLRLHSCCNAQSFLLDCADVGSREELTHLIKVLDYNLKLERDTPGSKCRSLGKVLSLAAEKLDLTLTPKHISLRGVRLLFRGVSHLHKLRLNDKMVITLAKAMRTGKGLAPVTVEEFSLNLNRTGVSQRALSRVLSCLALLLRFWTVQCLDLTSCRVKGHSFIILLCQQDPPKLRLSEENTQQLVMLLSEAQEVELTQSFLDKVGGDLSSCTLTQEVLLWLLQHHPGPVTVDFRKSKITDRNTRDLVPLLDRIRFKRLTHGFIMAVIREIYQTRSSLLVSSLLRSTENYINLTTRVLDAADCAALRFTLQHSQGVRLNLMWTSTPEGELESLLQLLSNVSQLSVDRQLLLRFLHCCNHLGVQQGAAAALQALQHKLDFSCSSAMDLTADAQEPPLNLRPEDCRVISMAIHMGSTKTKLTLTDCDIDEEGLEHLFCVLERVHLRCSKTQLLQLLTLVCVGSERECVRRAMSLSHAVGEEVDLSHTVLDTRACGSLALFLEYSEGLSELDLSHCQLTDNCLEPLLPHLHKIQVLDLSNNNITDEAQLIYRTVTATASIQTVRLFNNRIQNRKLYQGDKRFELW